MYWLWFRKIFSLTFYDICICQGIFLWMKFIIIHKVPSNFSLKKKEEMCLTKVLMVLEHFHSMSYFGMVPQLLLSAKPLWRLRSSQEAHHNFGGDGDNSLSWSSQTCPWKGRNCKMSHEGKLKLHSISTCIEIQWWQHHDVGMRFFSSYTEAGQSKLGDGQS